MSKNPVTPLGRDIAQRSPSRMQGGSQGGALIRAARGDLRSVPLTFDGLAPIRINADNNRCYFMIQNTGATDLRIGFGTTATADVGFLLTPTTSYELPSDQRRVNIRPSRRSSPARYRLGPHRIKQCPLLRLTRLMQHNSPR